jgi:3'(2'), 5'-bisphosphate nucleotidase
MNIESWREEFEVGLAAVREGALLARAIRRHASETSLLKPDQSPVTIADFAVQALIAHRLGQMFPDDPLVAEEESAALRTSAGQPMLDAVLASVRRTAPELDATRVLNLIDRGRAAPAERFWTLDPVDGTQGFVRGDQYVVALALIVGGHVAVGMIACPALHCPMPAPDEDANEIGWIACAVRGGGASAAPIHDGAFSPLHVSPHHDPSAARVLRSFDTSHIDLLRFNAIVETLGVENSPRLMDSQAKHALIAAGAADLLIRTPATKTFRDKIWDQAAGTLIVEEAGGRVTDLNGAPLDFGAGRLLATNEGLVASNGWLHHVALAAVQEAGQDRMAGRQCTPTRHRDLT